MDLLKSVKLELQALPHYGYKKNSQQRAEHFAQKPAILKPTIER